MSDEGLAAAPGLFANALKQVAMFMNLKAGKMRPVEVTQRPVHERVIIHKSGADGHLSPFDGIQQEQAQLAIKGVASPDHVEGGAGLEGIIRLPKRYSVGAEAVVADGLQLRLDLGFRGTCQPAGEEQVRLIAKGHGWLGVSHARPPFTSRKNPPELSVSLRIEAWRVC